MSDKKGKTKKRWYEGLGEELIFRARLLRQEKEYFREYLNLQKELPTTPNKSKWDEFHKRYDAFCKKYNIPFPLPIDPEWEKLIPHWILGNSKYWGVEEVNSQREGDFAVFKVDLRFPQQAILGWLGIHISVQKKVRGIKEHRGRRRTSHYNRVAVVYTLKKGGFTYEKIAKLFYPHLEGINPRDKTIRGAIRTIKMDEDKGLGKEEIWQNIKENYGFSKKTVSDFKELRVRISEVGRDYKNAKKILKGENK